MSKQWRESKKMKEEGKKITEIAHMLNIKPKEVYEYIKNFNRNSSLLRE